METLFSHEKLEVYRQALAFCASTQVWIETWPTKHSICDHLPRAAESIVDNLAAANATFTGMRRTLLDYAIGSTLECAACLDIAHAKNLLAADLLRVHKNELRRILGMLLGLRRRWEAALVKEERSHYETPSENGGPDPSFHHERMDVYALALETMRSLSESKAIDALPLPAFHQLDLLLTSVLLNIAEGNGRFSQADQRRFLCTSQTATVRMAAKLDLLELRQRLEPAEVIAIKLNLHRMGSMISAWLLSLSS